MMDILLRAKLMHGCAMEEVTLTMENHGDAYRMITWPPEKPITTCEWVAVGASNTSVVDSLSRYAHKHYPDCDELSLYSLASAVLCNWVSEHFN